MNQPLRRTRETTLSDDQLLLFDMLFDGYWQADALSSQTYALNMNVGYSHSLSDRSLQSTLQDFLVSKLVWRKPGGSAGKDIYTLSDNGGHLWEKERKPDWSSFVVTTQNAVAHVAEVQQMINCSSEQVGRLCAGALFASGLVIPCGPMRLRRKYNKRLIPWKSFAKVITIIFPVRKQLTESAVDWSVYERSRCWWSSTRDLIHAFQTPEYEVGHRKFLRE